jgi:hypothetical protein
MRTFITDNADAAVAGIADGSTILIGGFGMAGMPVTLIDALIRQGATELIMVNSCRERHTSTTRLVRDDARRSSRCLRTRCFPGLRARRFGELACRRPGRDSRRGLGDGPRHRRQVGLLTMTLFAKDGTAKLVPRCSTR